MIKSFLLSVACFDMHLFAFISSMNCSVTWCCLSATLSVVKWDVVQSSPSRGLGDRRHQFVSRNFLLPVSLNLMVLQVFMLLPKLLLCWDMLYVNQWIAKVLYGRNN